MVFGARRVGAHGHDYRERPVLDAQGLARLEAECGVALPDELREFLQTIHGAGPGPGYGLDVWGDPARSVRPFPYAMADLVALVARRRDDRFASLPMPDDDDDDGCWPPGHGFVAIAHHGCGAYDVIVVTGELRGTVWCCDMAWRPYTKSDRPSRFLDWYEDWLDRNLTQQSLARLHVP
jgi:hypothetical protein